jgi:hypothetical protein
MAVISDCVVNDEPLSPDCENPTAGYTCQGGRWPRNSNGSRAENTLSTFEAYAPINHEVDILYWRLSIELITSEAIGQASR